MSADDVLIIDVSLRDGIQSEKRLVPFTARLALVERLAAAGVRAMQVASFVHPKKVPQMADVETFVAALPTYPDVAYSGLVLNQQGLDRLMAAGLRHADLSLSCSDAHGRSNAGMPLEDAKAQTLAMTAAARQAGLQVRVGLQCAFGGYHGESAAPVQVAKLAAEFFAAGAHTVCLADSTGYAVPADITQVLQRLPPPLVERTVLHLHDTRGLGLANALAGYAAGVRAFDAALGGVGGCPFIPGASGNIASEDVVHLFDRMGVQTGIALDALADATALLEQALAYPLPGKVYRLRQNARARMSQDAGALARSAAGTLPHGASGISTAVGAAR